jgi:hypothetical protein
MIKASFATALAMRSLQLTPDFIPSRLFIYYNERVIEYNQSDSGAAICDGIKRVAKKGVCSKRKISFHLICS